MSTELVTTSSYDYPTRPSGQIQTYGIDLAGQFFGWGEKAGSPEFTLKPDQGLRVMGKPVIGIDWHTSQNERCPYFRYAFLEPISETDSRLSVLKLKCNGNPSRTGTTLVQNHVACLVGALLEITQQFNKAGLDLEEFHATLFAKKGEGVKVTDPRTGKTITYKGTFVEMFFDKDQPLHFQQAEREINAFQDQVNELAQLLGQPAPFLQRIDND